ncbi:SGNH/GDSL hydrolase family protein [Dyadobacter sp. BE31]|nr:SGNH/GDSL hydrolase family protein [Dyadobacter sp. BE31]
MKELHYRARRFFLLRALACAFAGLLPARATAHVRTGRKAASAEEDLKKVAALLNGKTRDAWVFTGDSITQGAKHTHGHRSYPEIFAERLRWELARVGDIVVNTGMSGHTTRHIMNDMDWRVGQFRPQVVSVMLGTNDCARNQVTLADFEANLTSIVAQIRAMNAVPILHTPNPIIAEKAPERVSLPEYVAVIRKVAGRENVILVDHYAEWSAAMASRSAEVVHREWLNDPLHPNQTGHRQLAAALFKTLNIFDPAQPTCGAAYYEGAH